MEADRLLRLRDLLIRDIIILSYHIDQSKGLIRPEEEYKAYSHMRKKYRLRQLAVVVSLIRGEEPPFPLPRW